MAARNIRVRGVRRKQIDEDKLALAFLLLAKVICDQDEHRTTTRHRPPVAGPDAPTPSDAEAA